MKTLKTLAALFLANLALFVWQEVYASSCLMLIFPFVITIIIMLGFIETEMNRKRCFVQCYLQTDTILYRFFMAKIMSIIKAFFLAFILSCALLIQVIFWNYQALILLLIDAIFLFFCYSFFKKLLQKQIKALILTAFAKHWAIILNVLVLMSVLTLLQLHSSIPHYLDNALEKTLIQATQNLHAHCPIIDFFVILNAQKEAIFWWLMVNASDNISNSLFKWLAWLSFLLSGSLSVWGYSRYLIEIISWVDKQEENHATS